MKRKILACALALALTINFFTTPIILSDSSEQMTESILLNENSENSKDKIEKKQEIILIEFTPKIVEKEKETNKENVVTTVPQEEEIVEKEDKVYLGKYTLTAYCPCHECSEGWKDQTSTGVRAKQGRTIAVDPEVIPYGTKVEINGNVYVAEDCGGAIKGNKIDIYFNSHSQTVKFGVQYAKVYLIR